MKKTNHILRPSELSFADLLIGLLKNSWAAILIALAAAITAWSVLGLSLPESYSESVTVSVRDTAVSDQWSSQLSASRTKAQSFVQALNTKSFNTDFASSTLHTKINAALSATLSDSANLITVTATAPTPEEAYLYLTAFVDNLDAMALKAGLTGVIVEAVTTPVMPSVSAEPALMTVLLAALAGGFAGCLALVALPILEGRISTRKAAERLTLLPIAGAVNRGGKGFGPDAILPPVNGEQTDGCYAEQFDRTAAYLLAQEGLSSNLIRVSALRLPSDRKNKKKNEKAARHTARIAMNLAIAMADAGAKVCLVDENAEAMTRSGRLTVLREMPDDASAYDRVITASEEAAEDGLILRTLEAGSANASQVNRCLIEGAGKAKESLFLYGARTVRDCSASYAENAPMPEGVSGAQTDEVDLFRWAAASLKALGRIRYIVIAALLLATAAAGTAALLSRSSQLRLDTVFTVATADMTAKYLPDELSAMSYEDTLEMMSAGGVNYDTDDLFSGNALYPTARSIDIELLMSNMPSLWNLSSTADLIAGELGEPSISERVSVSPNADERSYTLTVEGSDRERLEAVTDAFFAVAPNLSAHTAGGLTFKTGERTEATAGVSMALLIAAAWLIVLMAAAVYALVVGYNDRRLYAGYEAEELLGCKTVGKLPSKAVRNDLTSIDTSLARSILEWADAHQEGGVLMLTSALKEEGCDRLTDILKTLLERFGKKVTVIGPSSLPLSDGADRKSEYVLINCPALALESDAASAAEQADTILWAVRMGYADAQRIKAAVQRIDHRDKNAGCVIVK